MANVINGLFKVSISQLTVLIVADSSINAITLIENKYPHSKDILLTCSRIGIALSKYPEGTTWELVQADYYIKT